MQPNRPPDGPPDWSATRSTWLSALHELEAANRGAGRIRYAVLERHPSGQWDVEIWLVTEESLERKTTGAK